MGAICHFIPLIEKKMHTEKLHFFLNYSTFSRKNEIESLFNVFYGLLNNCSTVHFKMAIECTLFKVDEKSLVAFKDSIVLQA